ncbi:methyltransferase domain-containing protein [Sulfurimonas sp. CS5]|jgi:ubiquinone/menaquinone biosynthesis C-methylase UbiE|uniref:methyltransferase domain-containing protein n=1 Tax=Sulfurimonas sp. CS5 TaxID=3391145 RepID=UPI0039ED7A9F
MSNEENKKIKDGIKSTFDDVAKSYDKNKQFVISAKKMLEFIEINNENINILDLSTGTGNIAIELGKKFPNANIYGVDISDEMLNIARKKTKDENLKNITYQLQDVENLEFDNMQFDLITCGYGLFFYPNMDKVFCDVCSKLKIGGKFVFSTFNENAFQPYSKIFLDMLESNYGIKPPNSIEKRQLTSKDEIIEFSCQVKYKNLDVNDIDIRFPMSVKEWWELLNSTGYQGLLTQLNNDYSKFENEYIEHLKTLSDDDHIEFNADSFISVVSI